MRVQGIRHLVAAFDREVARKSAGVHAREDRIEIEVVEIRAAARHLVQQIAAADRLLERAQAEHGQDLAHLLGDEAEQVDHLVGRALELLAQLGPLRAHAHRAGVAVALADHDAAHGDQRRRADAVFLGAEHGRDHHVAPGLDAAVGAQDHAVAQPVQGQHLIDLGQAHLPRACRRT